MVRAALIAFLLTQFFTDASGVKLSAAPGLSVSNGIVYLAALSLMLRFATERDFKLEASGIMASFAVLCLYAVVSLIVTFNLLEYPGYNLLVSIYVLKGRLLDFAVYFGIFFWGTTSKKEAFSVLKVLLVLVGLANLATCLNALGIVHIAAMDDPHDAGRIGGLMGEPNQQGAFAVAFFPALIAMTQASRGKAKIFWVVVSVLSAAGLLVTGSRGALVGIVCGALITAYLYRDRLSITRILTWVASCIALLAVSLAVVSVQYGSMLYDRILEHSNFANGSALSSGRTDLWSTIVAPMFNHPISMITGFGWNSMPLFGIEAVSHNEYLDVWFNLGLVGLICYCLLFFVPIRHAWYASKLVGSPETNYLVAFVLGFIALSIAIFFVNLYAPWAYLWPYAALIMRIVSEIEFEHRQHTTAQSQPLHRNESTAFGWRAPTRPVRHLPLKTGAQQQP